MNFSPFIRFSNSKSCFQKSSKVIRQEFINYFVNDLDHTIIRSSPVAPLNDESVAFVNAGMNQFKGVFLGCCAPPAFNVVNSQKCIRVGGKHNDLDVVGSDSYHHTFFEMLGNWSFGNYFKEEACKYAWNLLTGPFQLKKEFLYVTYFGGDDKYGLKPDLQCKEIWLQLGVPENRIIPYGMKENFWEMGVTGPCGPCTEIHIDRSMKFADRSNDVNKGFADLVELWNLVFIQFERLENGTIVSLPNHHVDTGMGFERLVAVLQGKISNYDTDIFQPLFRAIQKSTNAPYYNGTFDLDKSNIDYGYRILADHARMITVALADNILPENNQKLRRVLRRAIDIAETIFKKTGLLQELSLVVIDDLGQHYPELYGKVAQVQKIIHFEEDLMKKLRNSSGKEWKKLVKTRPELSLVTDWMAAGLVPAYKELQSILPDLRKTNILPGNIAFKFYDTYGLTADTITELAKIELLTFNEMTLQKELEKAKHRSRIGIENHKLLNETLEKFRLPKTDDSFKYNYIISENGYKFQTLTSKIIGIVVNGSFVTSIKFSNQITGVDSNSLSNNSQKPLIADHEIGIILDKTLFYSTEGGQVSDVGYIHVDDYTFNVYNVEKIKGYVVHFGKFDFQESKNSMKRIEQLKAGNNCFLSIEPEKRINNMKHHTATHLLNAALKQIVGVVHQRSSIVTNHYLKFFFNTYGVKLSLEQIEKIEYLVNEMIESNVPVTTKIINYLEMLLEENLTLIPGEIYPYNDIQIVAIKDDNLKSVEACCGTHVHQTKVLEHFCILNYEMKGASRGSIYANCGEASKSARTVAENYHGRINKLKIEINKLKIDSSETFFQSLYTEANDMKRDLRDTNTLMSYVMRRRCIDEVDNLMKELLKLKRELQKARMITELANAVNSAHTPFVVHSFKNNIIISLEDIISCSSVPVLVITYTAETVKIQCYIPKEIISDRFNAQSWLEIAARIIDAECENIKGFDISSIGSLKIKKISHTVNESQLIKHIIKETSKFASMHIKQQKMSTKN